MTASQYFLDPLRGKTPLWKVAVYYSVVGGAALKLLFIIVAPTSQLGKQSVALVALIYGEYVVFSFYRCADNCPWPNLVPVIRAAAILSLLLGPFIAYLILSGRVELAT